MKTSKSDKRPTKEKKRPVYVRKEKTETIEMKEPEVHFYKEIPYILIGHPGFEQVYAVDDKLMIDYALTCRLRKIMENDNISA